MLCDACNYIDLVKATDRDVREPCLHHKTYANIRRSAASGCELCEMIVAYVSQDDKNAGVDWNEVESGRKYTQIVYYHSEPWEWSSRPWSSLCFVHDNRAFETPGFLRH
jgi:hypothetical protein